MLALCLYSACNTMPIYNHSKTKNGRKTNITAKYFFLFSFQNQAMNSNSIDVFSSSEIFIFEFEFGQKSEFIESELAALPSAVNQLIENVGLLAWRQYASGSSST